MSARNAVIASEGAIELVPSDAEELEPEVSRRIARELPTARAVTGRYDPHAQQ